MTEAITGKQLLHLVFGGEITQLDRTDFRDLSKLDIVGIFPSYAAAYEAWKAKAQSPSQGSSCHAPGLPRQ